MAFNLERQFYHRSGRIFASAKHLFQSARLICVVLTISLGPFICGVTLGFSSSVSAQLLLSDFLLAFFSSVINIGALLGSLMVAPALTIKGRRFSLTVAVVPTFVGWLMIAVCQDLSLPAQSPSSTIIGLLLIGRVLTGIGGGMLIAAGSVYLVELAPPMDRGRIGSVAQCAIVAGICASYGLGIYMTWFEIARFILAPTFFLFCLSFLLPESPVWLLKTGENSLALSTLVWLRIDPNIASSELADSDTNSIGEEQSNSRSLGLFPLIFPCILILPEFRPHLRMAMYLMFFQQLTGVNVITFYTETLCQKFVPISQSAWCAFSLGIAQLIFSLIACIFVDRFPRRVLIVATGIIMSISMFLFAIGQQFPNAIPVPPIAALIFFLFGYSCGWGPLAMLITLELFPASQRGPASGAAVATSWFTSYLVTQCSKPVMHLVGEFACFAFFSLVTAVGTLFFFHYLPETNQACMLPVGMLPPGRPVKWKTKIAPV